jgi:hypothetical protein
MMMMMIREARIFIDGFGKEENLNVLLFIYLLIHSHFNTRW